MATHPTCGSSCTGHTSAAAPAYNRQSRDEWMQGHLAQMRALRSQHASSPSLLTFPAYVLGFGLGAFIGAAWDIGDLAVRSTQKAADGASRLASSSRAGRA